MILVLFGVVILICGVALFIILLKKKLNGKIFLGILSIMTAKKELRREAFQAGI